MRLDISSNMREVISATEELFNSQLPFAMAKAMTRTAKDAQQALYREMDAVWDRPAPFSKRSLFVKPATKTDLTASVEIKDQFPSKATATPDEIYRHQFERGDRARKGIERWATSAGLISARELLVPGEYAKLDAYGNMARGQVAQIMSQLRLGLDPASWKSNSKRSQRNRKKSGVLFWSRGGHLRRGVWKREGRDVLPIMVVVDKAIYTPRMDMARVVNETIDANFSANLTDALAQAAATAR